MAKRNTTILQRKKIFITDTSSGGGGGGTGDVVGPSGATDGVPALFDGATGKLIKNSTPTGSGDPVLSSSPTLITPNLGTPSSGTLTNCSGLPVSGIVSSTSTALGLGSIELGHASDTTITRVSAGVVAIEGNSVLTTATGQPLDSDLTTIAGLTATTNNIMQSVSSAWASRTPAQVTATLSEMVGDSGSGGTKGLVPAPASGDSSKFLKGDGTWATPSGSGGSPGGSNTQVQWNNSSSFDGISGATTDGTTLTLIAPVLGTPASGTLTNCSGLPLSGITSSTSTALGVGSLELGHASDTTLTRSSAGVLAVEGVVIPSISSTNTFTNKRITKRVVTASDATSITPNTDNADITYQANTQSTGTLTINADGGTPTNGQSWLLKIKSTNVQTFSWNSAYAGGTVALPTSTTGSSKIDYFSFIYDTVNSKWHFVGTALGF